MKDVCPVHHVWYNLGEKCPECQPEVAKIVRLENYQSNQKMFGVVKGLLLALLVFFGLVVLVAALNSK
jgi:hypothetical protein